MDTNLINLKCLQKATLPAIQSFPMKNDGEGNYYVSAYNDPQASTEDVRSAVHSICELFNISQSQEVIYVATVLKAKMTCNQLLDSIGYIYSNWDSTKFGKPKPADIVKYDKVQNDILFSCDEMIRMTYGMADKYGKTYDYTKDKLFQIVKDSLGRIVYGRDGKALFVFTPKGEQLKNEILTYINE